jgi:peptidoglycan/xylan/chitin deacetylase (PgdA/CDA1 family)
MSGTFVISLDFELHWGGFEKWPLRKEGESYVIPQLTNDYLNTENSAYNAYFTNTRRVIPEMLRDFDEAGVHVTWATVGMLFAKDRPTLRANFPLRKPTYAVRELSAYEFIETQGIGNDENDDPYHFAPSLVERIIRTAGQELGTHTFAHYYCNEAGQSVDQFHDDLRAAQRAAQNYGTQLRSLVFPRNQFNDQYLRVCYEEGIRIVRSNPLDWFWKIDSTQSESFWKRLNRGMDAYLPVGKKNTYRLDSLPSQPGLPLCLPASRLLRPYRPKEGVLNQMKITRIKEEMTRAAQKGEVYHLWWHPHNFGHYPSESLAALKEILLHFSHCRDKYQMTSLNMGEIAGLLEKREGVK